MVLTQPLIGSTGWGAAVNLNFQTLEDFCNATNVPNGIVKLDGSGHLPALNGAALSDLAAAAISAGGTLPALNGSALTDLAAGALASGTVDVARLPVMVGDGGGGGTAGLVPAPAAGDAPKFLTGAGTWQAVVPVAVFKASVYLTSGYVDLVDANIVPGSVPVAAWGNNTGLSATGLLFINGLSTGTFRVQSTNGGDFGWVNVVWMN